MVFSKETGQDLLELAKSFRDDADIFSTASHEPLKTLTFSRLMERISSFLHTFCICKNINLSAYTVDEKRRQRFGHHDSRRHLRRGLRGKHIEEVKLAWPIELFLDMCMTFLCFGAPYSYQRRIDEFFITGLRSLHVRRVSD